MTGTWSNCFFLEELALSSLLLFWAQDSWDTLQTEKYNKKINMKTYKSSSNLCTKAMPSNMLS